MKWDYDTSFVLYEEGRSAMEAGNVDKAVELLEKSTLLAPHYKTLELLGECMLERKEFARAVIYLAASASLGTNQARPRFLLAKALLHAEEPQAAIPKLEEALVINPDFKAARELLTTLK